MGIPVLVLARLLVFWVFFAPGRLCVFQREATNTKHLFVGGQVPSFNSCHFETADTKKARDLDCPKFSGLALSF